MRAIGLLCLLAVGCGTTQISQWDLKEEEMCRANMEDKSWLGGASYHCQSHLSDLAERRAALKAAETEARREPDCYVLLEDPNATPQARGECRQYLAGLAEQRAEARAASQRGATITAGALAAPKK